MTIRENQIQNLANRVTTICNSGKEAELICRLTGPERNLLEHDVLGGTSAIIGYDREFAGLERKVSTIERELNGGRSARVSSPSVATTRSPYNSDWQAAEAAEAARVFRMEQEAARAIAEEARVLQMEQEAAQATAEAASVFATEQKAARATSSQSTNEEGSSCGGSRPTQAPTATKSRRASAKKAQGHSQAQNGQWLNSMMDLIKAMANGVGECLGQLATVIGSVCAALWQAFTSICASMFKGLWGNSATQPTAKSSAQQPEKSAHMPNYSGKADRIKQRRGRDCSNEKSQDPDSTAAPKRSI